MSNVALNFKMQVCCHGNYRADSTFENIFDCLEMQDCRNSRGDGRSTFWHINVSIY